MKHPPSVALLEAELTETLKAVADCFAQSRLSTPANDEHGHRRGREIDGAVSLLKVSAELGIAIARINGEYNQNINVLHGEIWPPRRAAKPETLSEERPARGAVPGVSA
ncbi:MAG: hypothetical protein KGJ78_06640 [Alphaproteobacteria bacterium]|nr:hypothetical protein [Alphaproteobacteria bacterium]